MTTIGFTPDAARRIVRATQNVERADLIGRPINQPLQIDDQWVTVTSTSKVGNLYPGKRLDYSQVDDSWTEKDTVWVRPANDLTPKVGDRYRGRRHGFKTGKVVYTVRVDGVSDGEPSLALETGIVTSLAVHVHECDLFISSTSSTMKVYRDADGRLVDIEFGPETLDETLYSTCECDCNSHGTFPTTLGIVVEGESEYHVSAHPGTSGIVVEGSSTVTTRGSIVVEGESAIHVVTRSVGSVAIEGSSTVTTSIVGTSIVVEGESTFHLTARPSGDIVIEGESSRSVKVRPSGDIVIEGESTVRQQNNGGDIAIEGESTVTVNFYLSGGYVEIEGGT